MEQQPENTETTRTGEDTPDVLALKEVVGMLGEMFADEQSVLAVIEEVLLEPYPDPSDEAAMIEYTAKMRLVQQVAETQLSRSELLLDIQGRILNKLDNLQTEG